MRNQDIRTVMHQDRIAFWRVAEVLGIHYNTFGNWLNKDLTTEKRKQIFSAIQAAKERRDAEERRDIEEGRCKC